jgi:hypothetical protein
MMFDFNSVFAEVDWSKIKLIDNSPCIDCPHKAALREKHPGNTWDSPPECSGCIKYAAWNMKCLQKLAWYESKEK